MSSLLRWKKGKEKEEAFYFRSKAIYLQGKEEEEKMVYLSYISWQRTINYWQTLLYVRIWSHFRGRIVCYSTGYNSFLMDTEGKLILLRKGSSEINTMRFILRFIK